MKETKQNSLEKEFQQIDTHLTGLYDATLEDIPADEKKVLRPILESLREERERYAEVELIAEGGDKRVTKTYDKSLNREVAMAKAIHQKTDREQEKFLREAQLGANLDHPYIVPVYNVGIHPDGSPFFTMKLIPGDSLKNVIDRLREGDETYAQGYPLDVRLTIFLKICDAIAYAHSRNVLHLDIKPDNIRLGKFGEVYVCDWGLADIVFHEHQPAYQDPDMPEEPPIDQTLQSELIRGTPGYMAPEQTIPDGLVSNRTDVYALGALLYALLSYTSPVQGDSHKERIRNTTLGNITPLHESKTSRRIPRGLAAIAMKALSTNPEDRYQEIQEIRKDINRYLSDQPTLAERASPLARFSLLVKRHNRLASIVLFSLFSIAMVISLSLAAVNRKKAEAVSARETAEKNFALYRAQQKETSELNAELSELISFALQNKDYAQAQKKIRILTIAQNKPSPLIDPEELLLQKGTMHFVLGQFNQANQCFRRAESVSGFHEILWNLSNQFSQIKPKDYERLTPPQLTKLIRSATYINDIIFYFYFHHIQAVDIPPEQHVPLAVAMLDKLNRIHSSPTDSPIRLEERENGLHLNLTHSPYITYTLVTIGRPWKNILSPLPIYSMDISGLPLRHLSELCQLQVKELHMVGLQIYRPNNLPRQIKQMGVKKLIIDTDAYPDEIIQELKELCEVIHKDR